MKPLCEFQLQALNTLIPSDLPIVRFRYSIWPVLRCISIEASVNMAIYVYISGALGWFQKCSNEFNTSWIPTIPLAILLQLTPLRGDVLQVAPNEWGKREVARAKPLDLSRFGLRRKATMDRAREAP